ncbi:hypothetical protein EVC30_020 [Rhizobium phage RHph_Y1_11]|nr:hypothetical protein EVC30_020 [Rhizobium phage RHph_Y1_11]
MTGKAPNLVAFAMDVTGSPTASLLLLRIIYWSKYAKRFFGEHNWIAKQAIEWREDTGLTDKQYQAAIALLKREKIVVVERHIYKDRPCSHVRITPEFRDRINLIVRDAIPPSEGSPQSPFLGNPYIQTDIETDSTTDIAPPPGEHLVPENLEEDFSGEEPQKEPEMAHSVLDVVKGKLAPKPGAKHKPQVTQAVQTWQTLAGEVTGKFQAGFTAKQMGQMKQFCTGAPPKADVIKMITDVVKDWFTFIDEVKSQTGWKNAPPEPEFGFFFYHRQIAYNFKAATGKQVPIVKSEVPAGDPLGGLKPYKAGK